MKDTEKSLRPPYAGLAAAALGALLALPALAQVSAAMPDDFSGVWTRDPMRGNLPSMMPSPNDKTFTLADGSPIPLLPAAEKTYRERVAQSQTEHVFATTQSRCLPIGTPGNMMGAPYPIQFVQRPEFAVILFEEGWGFRPIYMNGKHPERIFPSFFGHSIGHWEGKTLVVDTVALRADTTLNATGLPHSTNMRVIERFSRAGPDTLVDQIEIRDPETYSKPFVLTSVFTKTDVFHKREDQMIEYICEDSRIQVTPDGRQTYGEVK
jgi:hypothetical protein